MHEMDAVKFSASSMYRTSINLSPLMTNLNHYVMHREVFSFMVQFYFDLHTPPL